MFHVMCEQGAGRGSCQKRGTSPRLKVTLSKGLNTVQSRKAVADTTRPAVKPGEERLNRSATTITQDFLDRQGAATMAGDVDATLAWCDLPCTLESFEGKAVATTEAEMRGICEAFILNLQEKRLKLMVRECVEAMFKDDNTIWATYETRYVAEHNLRSQDPYFGFVILRRKADRWKISAMQFAVSSDSPANDTLRKWAMGHS